MRTRLPSLILGAILIIIGVQIWILGLVGDVLAVNRKLLEDIQLRLRRSEYDKASDDPLKEVSRLTR